MSSESEPVLGATLRYGMYNVKKNLDDAINGLKGTKYGLADIPNTQVKDAMAGLIRDGDETAWIYAWQGNTYAPSHPVLYRNGNIVPTDDATQEKSYVVQWVDE